MRRSVAAATAVVVAAVLASGRLAWANPLATTSRTLASSTAPVAACGDLSGVVADFTISSGTVTAVLLSGFPASCNGGSVSVTLSSGATAIGSGGPATVSGGGAAIPVSPAPPTSAVTHVHFVVIGP